MVDTSRYDILCIHMKKISQFVMSILNRGLSYFGLQMKRTNAGLWDSDAAFMQIYKNLQKNTLVRIDRCYSLYQLALMEALSQNGDVAQVGVYRGGTARMIAECFAHTQKKFYLFDTFEGLPSASEEDGVSGSKNNEVKQFTNVDFNEVKNLFSGVSNVAFRKGYFPDTAQGLEGHSFCFVYLDADLYTSIRDGLAFFYPRMIRGGVIVIDDYGTDNWPGVEKAVHEFCVENNVACIKNVWWQGLIIKN